MWFLYFWGISTGCTLLIWLISSRAMSNKMKREYIFCEEKRNKISISEYIITILPMIIPFINCLFPLIYIFGFKNLYEKIVKDYIKTGYISGNKTR